MNKAINNLDWAGIADQFDKDGFVVLRGLLDGDAMDRMSAQLLTPDTGDRFEHLDGLKLGQGIRRQLGAGLPEPLASWPADFYTHLAPIANRWSAMLNRAGRFPSQHGELQRGEGASRQRGWVIMNRLQEGDFHALHHDVDAQRGFPIQVVMLLSDPRTAFSGGEFVMVEQRPRMQSRPMVLPLVKGSVALISAAHRPCKGANGHYRVSTRHAISRVRSGVRVCVELLFDVSYQQQETESLRRLPSILSLLREVISLLFHSTFNKEHIMSKEETNKAIVGRWFTEFWGATYNPAVIDDIAAPDMLLQYSLHEPRNGREDIKAFMADFRAAFPDLAFAGAAELIAEGDYVVGRWIGGGTHTGPAFDDFLIGSLPPATGRAMRFTGTTVLRLKDGMIVEELGLDDGVTALQQLGLFGKV